MKFELQSNALLGSSRQELISSHDGEELRWNITKFSSSTVDQIDFDLFDQINAYWASRPKEKQAQIFQIYKRLRQVFDEVYGREVLTSEVRMMVNELIELHPLNDIAEWIKFHGQINIPACLEERYVPNQDKPSTRTGTYLKKDYQDLVVLALVLRVMIPIWGEYILQTKDDTGNLKEFYAYQLLNETEIPMWPAITKLAEYIEANTPKETPHAAIIACVSSEEYPRWVMALIVVRRVCVGDIRGIDPTTAKLVAHIYKFIDGKTNADATRSSFNGIVKPKKDKSSGDDEDGAASIYEQYKIRQDVSIGTKKSLELSIEDVTRAVLHVAPDLPLKLLEDALESSQQLLDKELTDTQIYLPRWIFNSYISPRAYPYFNKQYVIRMLAAAQAVLWHWGYYELAGIVTGIPTDAGFSASVNISGMRLLSQTLDALYPYHRRSTSRARNTKVVNQALYAIELIASKIREYDWRLTLPDEYLPTVTGKSGRRILVVPGNIQERLATLVIERVSLDGPLVKSNQPIS